MRSTIRIALVLASVTGSMLTVVACTSATSHSSQTTTLSAASSPNPSSPAVTSGQASSATPLGPPAAPLPRGTITIHARDYTGLGELTVGPDGGWLGDGPFRIDPRHDTIGKALSGQIATDLSAD